MQGEPGQVFDSIGGTKTVELLGSKKPAKVVLYGKSNDDESSDSSDSNRGVDQGRGSRDGVISIFKTVLHQLKNNTLYHLRQTNLQAQYHNPATLKNASPLRASSEKDVRELPRLRSVKRGSLDLGTKPKLVIKHAPTIEADKENIANVHNTQIQNLELKKLFQKISIVPGQQTSPVERRKGLTDREQGSTQTRGRETSQDPSEANSVSEHNSTRRSLNIQTASSRADQGRVLLHQSHRRPKYSVVHQKGVQGDISITIKDCSPKRADQIQDKENKPTNPRSMTSDSSAHKFPNTARIRTDNLVNSKQSRRSMLVSNAEERTIFRIARRESSLFCEHQERASLARVNPLEECFPVHRKPLKSVVIDSNTFTGPSPKLNYQPTGKLVENTFPDRETSQTGQLKDTGMLARRRQPLRTDQLSSKKAPARLFLPIMNLNRRDFK